MNRRRTESAHGNEKKVGGVSEHFTITNKPNEQKTPKMFDTHL
jgi:hypothetical protein